MAANTKAGNTRGRQERKLSKKQKKIRRRRKLIGILAAELLLLLILGIGVWGLVKWDLESWINSRILTCRRRTWK